MGPLKLKAFDKQNVCVKKDKSLNYFDMVRPSLSKSADAGSNDNLCPETDREGRKLKLCGTKSDMEYKMCIPENSECPLMDLAYDLNTNELVKKVQNGNQFPLVGLTVSQGKPCIFSAERNSNSKKDNSDVYHPMLKEANFDGCLTEVEGRKLSTMWREIDQMPEVSEYDVIKDNDALKYLKYIPNWKATSYKDFNVQLY